MANWHYFNESGKRIGPIRGRELKQLAQQGEITPETRVEDEQGHTALAKNVTGLRFPDSERSESTSPPTVNSPSIVPHTSHDGSNNSVSNYYYTDENGYKFGPITEERLQTLAERGTVTPMTPLETETGHKGLAGQIPSLKFNTVVPPVIEPTLNPSENADTAILFWFLFGASCFLAFAGIWIWIILTWIALPIAIVFLVLAVRSRDKKTGKNTIRDWGGVAFSFAEQATRPVPMKTAPSETSVFFKSDFSRIDYERSRCYFFPASIGCLPIIVVSLGSFLLWNVIAEGTSDISRFEHARVNANAKFERSKKNAFDEFEWNKTRTNDEFKKNETRANDDFEKNKNKSTDGDIVRFERDRGNAIDKFKKDRDSVIDRFMKARNDAIAGFERDKNNALAEIARERTDSMTNHLIWFLTGLGTFIAGVVLIVKVIRTNKISDAEIDKICSEYLSNTLQSMALDKLGIDEEQVRTIEPIQLHGYYYSDITSIVATSAGSSIKHSIARNFGTSPVQYKSSVQYKMGKDRRLRASNYNKTIYFFSAEQVYCYNLRFSILGEEKQEATSESYYGDVVFAETVSDAVTYRSGVATIPVLAETLKTILGSVLFDFLSAVLFGNETENVKFEEFTLTTSGGTTMGTIISDPTTAERSIQGMKNLLREKKRQVQGLHRKLGDMEGLQRKELQLQQKESLRKELQ